MFKTKFKVNPLIKYLQQYTILQIEFLSFQMK